jgi:hypothetical protein
MKFLAAAMVFLTLAGARAQTAVDPFAERPPDEASPFMALAGLDEREQSKITAPQRGYPRMPAPEDTLGAKLKSFYIGAVSSLQGRGTQTREVATLSIEPQDPLLKETRELDAIYTVRNTGRQMTRIEFLTTQRLEMVTRNASGGVVERWSDDRSFQPIEGIVVINPDERIEFQEQIPTRDMRAGGVYTVEASLATEPDYAVEQTVQPR